MNFLLCGCRGDLFATAGSRTTMRNKNEAVCRQRRAKSQAMETEDELILYRQESDRALYR